MFPKLDNCMDQRSRPWGTFGEEGGDTSEMEWEDVKVSPFSSASWEAAALQLLQL